MYSHIRYFKGGPIVEEKDPFHHPDRLRWGEVQFLLIVGTRWFHGQGHKGAGDRFALGFFQVVENGLFRHGRDRKSTRLNSSHVSISYAVFCLKKKTNRRSSE